MDGFKALGLSSQTLEALKLKGFEHPSEIQELTIPLLLQGQKNIVGQAQTGSGKTAAFGLPVIEKFEEDVAGVQTLILTPTRELALQVGQELISYQGERKIPVTTIYGGASIQHQIKDLKRGAGIVVGTPGRIIDLIKRKKLHLDKVRYVVLDEADEMLNMGFLEDVELILSHCNTERRMLLFSATMAPRILSLAERYMGAYELVRVKNKPLITQRIEQSYVEVRSGQKFDALCRILEMEKDFYGIVFCNMKVEVAEVTTWLNEKGYVAESLHGDVTQNLREKVIRQFRSSDRGMLVATDVAARGLDIRDLTHVINYGMPQDTESYVHRIGRTGRAGKTGKAISILKPGESRKLSFVEKKMNAKIDKVRLPDADEMVALKKSRLNDQISKVIAEEQFLPFMEYSQELVSGHDSPTVIAALLKIFQGEAFDYEAYSSIQQSDFSEERRSNKGRRRKKRGGRKKKRTGNRDRSEMRDSGKRSDWRKKGKKRKKRKGKRPGLVSS